MNRVRSARVAPHAPASAKKRATVETMQERPIRQGEIFWIAAQALRPSVDGVAHPHVVIQDDVLNQSRIPTTVVCGLSTNQKRAHEPGNILLVLGEGGLPQVSVVIVSQVSVVEKDVLTQPVGRLSEERMRQIVTGLRFLQASFFDQ